MSSNASNASNNSNDSNDDRQGVSASTSYLKQLDFGNETNQ
jgi:hypothetical protein